MALAKIIKVYWHCLIRAIALKTNHRMSTLIVFETKLAADLISDNQQSKVYHFCSCGYLEPDFPGINWNSG